MSQYYYNPFGNSSDVNEAMIREQARKQQMKNEKHEIRIVSLCMGCAIVAFVLIQSLLATVLALFDLYDLFTENAVFQYAFNIIAGSVCSVALPFGIVALINKSRYTGPVVPTKSIKKSRCFAWIGFGMLVCIASNYLVALVILLCKNVFGIQLTKSDFLEPDSVFACIMFVVAVAIIPAICEEFAMRCCSLQLLRKYGKGFAIFAVSIVFGILHGNVIQFVFAFCIGIVLGYVTIKTDSVIPAILIHALNNGMSAVQSIVTFAAGEKISDYITIGMYIGWIAIGIIGLVYLLATGEFKSRAEDKSKSVLTAWQKIWAFLFPWMIVPFGILLALTAQYIEKV